MRIVVTKTELAYLIRSIAGQVRELKAQGYEPVVYDVELDKLLVKLEKATKS